MPPPLLRPPLPPVSQRGKSRPRLSPGPSSRPYGRFPPCRSSRPKPPPARPGSGEQIGSGGKKTVVTAHHPARGPRPARWSGQTPAGAAARPAPPAGPSPVRRRRAPGPSPGRRREGGHGRNRGQNHGRNHDRGRMHGWSHGRSRGPSRAGCHGRDRGGGLWPCPGSDSDRGLGRPCRPATSARAPPAAASRGRTRRRAGRRARSHGRGPGRGPCLPSAAAKWRAELLSVG